MPLANKTFPIQCHLDHLDKYELGYIPWHWHPEAEFVVVLEGRFRLVVNQSEMLLEPGEGAFINANALHMGHRQDCDSVVIRTIVFDPLYISGPADGPVYSRYVQPFLASACPLDHLRLAPDGDWQAMILESVLDACYLEEDRPYGYEMQQFSQLFNAWMDTLLHLPADYPPCSSTTMEFQKRIKTMLNFIHSHYNQLVTIERVATSAGLSVSECLRCFHQCLDTTPIAYLMRYRVERAMSLLRQNAGENMADIAGICGFNSSAYFCKVFRDITGMNATVYQRRAMWGNARYNGFEPFDFDKFGTILPIVYDDAD